MPNRRFYFYYPVLTNFVTRASFYTKPIHFQYVAPKSIINAKAISVSGMPDVLRCVYRQYKAEAYNVLQNHRHAYNVNARRFKLLQYGNYYRYNGRCKAGGTGKAHVDNDKENGHYSEHH